MYEGLGGSPMDVKGLFSPKPTPIPVVKPAVPVFDMSKYLTPFLSDQSIRNMADQVSAVEIPRSPWVISLIFMALKVFALSSLYAMWTKNKENQMAIDKQAFNAALTHQLEQDNENN